MLRMSTPLMAVLLATACAGNPTIHEGPGGATGPEVAGFGSTGAPDTTSGDDAPGSDTTGATTGDDTVIAGEDPGTGGRCTPTCLGKHCGDDGCGGSCGLCPAQHTCVDNKCQADCDPGVGGRGSRPATATCPTPFPPTAPT